jgi:hypothetical protein
LGAFGTLFCIYLLPIATYLKMKHDGILPEMPGQKKKNAPSTESDNSEKIEFGLIDKDTIHTNSPNFNSV